MEQFLGTCQTPHKHCIWYQGIQVFHIAPWDFCLLVQLEIQTAHHKHKMMSINPWILIFNVHPPPYYPHHHHQHIPPYQRRQNSLSLSKLTVYTNQNMSSLVLLQTPALGVLQPIHSQPTQISIFCHSTEIMAGAAPTRTSLKPTWQVHGMMGPSPHLLDDVSSMDVLGRILLTLWCYCQF